MFIEQANQQNEKAIKLYASELGEVSVPLAVERSRLGIWRGAFQFGSTGLLVEDAFAALSVFELAGLPDLVWDSNADRSPGELVDKIASSMKSLIEGFHGLGDTHGIALRYLFDPPSNRVRVFLVIRSLGHNIDESKLNLNRARQIVRGTFPRQYRIIERKSEDSGLLNLSWVTSGVEILKPEHAIRSLYDKQSCGFEFYYSPELLRPAGDNMASVCAALLRETKGFRTLLDVTLVPAEPLSHTENLLLQQSSDICRQWSQPQKIEVQVGVLGKTQIEETEADHGAARTLELLTELKKRYGDGRKLYTYALRVLTEDRIPPLLLAQRWAQMALTNNPQFLSLEPGSDELNKTIGAAKICSLSPSVCNDVWKRDSAPETIRRLHRLADSAEIGGFFRLPVQTTGHFPGIEEDQVKLSAPGTLRKLFPDRFWSSSTTNGIQAPIGWHFPQRGVKEHRIYHFELNDGAPHGLIAGSSGSGKSSMLHTLILSLCAHYSPDELELYLVDFKSSEFRRYENLPHGRVVSATADRNFGLKVLHSLIDEKTRREKLFAEKNAKDFDAYRRQGGKLPRALLIVDEFQTLFEKENSDDTIAREASDALNTIATKFRSYGIHMLLATQSLGQGSADLLSAQTRNQCGMRIALKMNNPRDASFVLNDNPEEIEIIRERGQALCRNHGVREGNCPINIAYGEGPEDFDRIHDECLKKFASLASSDHNKSFFYDGDEQKRQQKKDAPRTAEELMPREIQWTHSSARELRVPIGWQLPRGLNRYRGFSREEWPVVDFYLGKLTNHSLVLGKSGSGKSSFYHTLILGLTARYSPDELELYLLDMKEDGVEFKQYSNLSLPHAKVVCTTSDPEYGAEQVARVAEEIKHRGELGVRELAEYREETGKVIPRTLLVIDEFQSLFDGSRASREKAEQALRTIAKKGRSYGVHLILASQNLATEAKATLPKDVKSECTLRIAFSLNQLSFASAVLEKRPEDISLLEGAGQAIFEDLAEGPENAKNIPVQVAYSPRELIERQVQKVCQIAHAQSPEGSSRAPRVFSSSEAPKLEDNPILQKCLTSPNQTAPRVVSLFLGENLDADGSLSAQKLKRDPGSNLLIVGRDEDAARESMLAVGASALLQIPSGERRLIIVNYSDEESEAYDHFNILEQLGGEDVTVGEREDLTALLQEVNRELEARDEGTSKRNDRWLLMIFGLHRARPLIRPRRPQEEKKAVEQLLELGADNKMHMILWSTSYSKCTDVFESRPTKEGFGNVLALSQADANAILRGAGSFSLSDGQALLIDSGDPDASKKMRPYRGVYQWLETLVK